MIPPRQGLRPVDADQIRLTLAGIGQCDGSGDDDERFTRLIRWFAERDLDYDPPPFAIITQLLRRFPAVVRELGIRHGQRPAMAQVNDEYDVQDLLRGILTGLFSDVRGEEPTPAARAWPAGWTSTSRTRRSSSRPR
jgi:hypothetical protein